MAFAAGIGLGALWTTFLLAAHMVRRLLSDWTRAAIVAAFVGLCVLLGPHDGSALAFWGAVSLLPWRLLHRSSWERCVGSWARPAWRRWRLYDYHWLDLMEQCYFVRPRRLAPDVVPRIVNVATRRPKAFPQSSWDTVIVRTERSVEDFGRQTDYLAHVLGARSCRAYTHPRVRGLLRRHPAVRLELGFGADPLEQPVAQFPIPERPEDVDLSAIPVGITEFGEVWTLPVIGSHLICAGIMGSGKGSVMWSLIRGMAPLIRDGSVRLWGWDPKRGVELNLGRGEDGDDGLFYRYCDGSITDMADMLGEAVTTMLAGSDRLKRERLRKLERPSPDWPLNVLNIDEFAQITAKQADTGEEKGTALTARIDRSIGQLVNVGRAPGFPIIGFLQSPTIETNKHRNEFPCKVALRLEGGKTRTELILPPGSYDQGAECDRIDPRLPGVGYVTMPGMVEPVRVRATYVSDSDIAELVAKYKPVFTADGSINSTAEEMPDEPLPPVPALPRPTRARRTSKRAPASD
jgi:S-DNA-T family DNA segregation ATPase FtsK/SpoIIIE